MSWVDWILLSLIVIEVPKIVEVPKIEKVIEYIQIPKVEQIYTDKVVTETKVYQVRTGCVGGCKCTEGDGE